MMPHVTRSKYVNLDIEGRRTDMSRIILQLIPQKVTEPQMEPKLKVNPVFGEGCKKYGEYCLSICPIA